MKILFIVTAFLLAFIFPQSVKADSKIKDEIIKQSIKDYKIKTGGTCPCPYNVNRAGRKCRGSSAYSKPGGEEPKCYPDDVTKKDIEDYKRKQ